MGLVRSTALSLGLGVAIVYLATHAVIGRNGLTAYMDLQKQERALISERAALTAERAQLERRASRLRAESLDLDYLDEKARELLGASDPGELVFTVE
jgi:cell division protein FtsB